MTATRPDPSVDLSELERDYLVKRELGHGGMGSVFLARHRTAGHDVAIKVISSKYIADADALSRFEREARLMARIRHPNIVHQYELRRLNGGHVALVMQYVRGESLITILRRRGKLRFDECAQILRDIGLALEHAHANGIIHRDVKPHNILIDADKGSALLSDFGIAKATQGDSEVTATGMAIGTPAYMAPEQIDNAAVDGRADLYSLGVVGWEMLSGKRAWEGESLFGIIYKQKHQDLAPLTLLRPDAPQRLLLALEGALEKDPERRWASASEFVEQLRSDTPTSAMLRRREAAGALLATGESPAEPASAGAATIPFRRAAGESAAVSTAPTSELPALDAGSNRGSAARMAMLVGGGALAGALGFYAMFGGGVRSGSPGRSSAPREGGVPQAEAAAVPTRPGDGPGTVGSSVAAARGMSGVESLPSLTGRLIPTSSTPSNGTVAAPSVPGLGAPVTPPREAAPARSRALADAAIALLRSRQPDAARRMVDSALAMDPTDADAFALRARANALRGDLRAAWADAEVTERLGDSWQAQTLIASFEARVGERRKAEYRLSQLVKRVSPKLPFSAKQGSQLALAYVATGDTRRALNALLRTRDDGTLEAALKDPGFDPIRGEPRFRDILRAVAPDAQ
ncbi:MAG TPA: protein kinase [Gemmatimonadaceae bacterium]|nr:protein kinase [Gemmatimonadaceae bacterium]